MIISSEPFDYIRTKLPLRVVSAARGVGSFLTFDLADATNPIPTWMFWVYLCDWSLVEDGDEILDSRCMSDEEYRAALKELVGVTLNFISSVDEGETCKLEFSGNIELFLDDAGDLYGEGQDMLKIFHGGASVLRFRSGSGFVFTEQSGE